MARHSRHSRTRSSNTSKRPSALLTVLVAFFSGYLCANLLSVNEVAKWGTQTWNALHSKTKQLPNTATSQRKELPKPKFEFYTLLSNDHPGLVQPQKPKTAPMPSNEVREISNAIQAHVREATPLSAIKEKTNRHYDVQLASYNKKSDAERLKASLLLRDFNARIETVNQKNGHWYRVVIGPYSSKRAAEKAQLSIVRSDKVMGIIRRLDA